MNKIYRRFCAALLTVLMLLMTVQPALAAEYSFPYPTVRSKKGLYVCPGMEEDALELGVQHTTLNLSVGDFLCPAGKHQNASECHIFTYNGKKYYFAKNAVARYDNELIRLAQNNVVVTAILLLPRFDAGDYRRELIYPAARGGNANYYQWNMDDSSAVEALRAIVTFFQRRYSNQSGPRIVGWIVGNEVNNSRVWNWAGNIGVDKYVDLYAAQVAEVWHAAKSVYENARIYMCLDHYWTQAPGNYWYAGKPILTKFAKRMKARGLGNGTWNIAYHPYNVSQYVPDIMNSKNNAGTRIITMKTLSTFTRFVKKKYGKNCRVILSEQGFSSVTAGLDTTKDQARSVALAYYIAQQNSQVDSLILHRQVDHTGEGERYGLYTSTGGENPGRKKLSWKTYKFADTTKTTAYTKYAAKQAKKLSKKKVKKLYTVQTGSLTPIGGLNWSMNLTNSFGAYGAAASFSLTDRYTLTRDTGRNSNISFGIKRGGHINLNKMPTFGFGIIVNGSSSASAEITVRLWSGGTKYFEAAAAVGCSVQNYLGIDLSKWEDRKNITQIDILVNSGGAAWASGSNVQIFGIGAR